mmetsp:Transcript_9653/g.21970  ORF Transcript_9653/g.21970 Transcript_9653/m.21970 type:complete len:210 (+) Transcript_9653:4156-4785(+)
MPFVTRSCCCVSPWSRRWRSTEGCGRALRASHRLVCRGKSPSSLLRPAPARDKKLEELALRLSRNFSRCLLLPRRVGRRERANERGLVSHAAACRNGVQCRPPAVITLVCKLLGRRTSLKAPFRLLALDLHLFAILLFQMMLSRVFSTAVRAVTIRLAPMTMMMAMIIVMGTVLRRMMLLVVVVLGFVIAMSFAMMLLLVMMMAVMSIR